MKIALKQIVIVWTWRHYQYICGIKDNVSTTLSIFFLTQNLVLLLQFYFCVLIKVNARSIPKTIVHIKLYVAFCRVEDNITNLLPEWGGNKVR